MWFSGLACSLVVVVVVVVMSWVLCGVGGAGGRAVAVLVLGAAAVFAVALVLVAGIAMVVLARPDADAASKPPLLDSANPLCVGESPVGLSSCGDDDDGSCWWCWKKAWCGIVVCFGVVAVVERGGGGYGAARYNGLVTGDEVWLYPRTEEYVA